MFRPLYVYENYHTRAYETSAGSYIDDFHLDLPVFKLKNKSNWGYKTSTDISLVIK
jgi:hypothetical protein